jgi:beta-N-acetylhexosaminidase
LRFISGIAVLLSAITAPLPIQAQNTSTATTGVVAPAPAADAQLAADQQEEAQLNQQVEALLAAMSPQDKVGQLFILTFDGSDTTANSDIAELIHTYRIGGVVLSPQHHNFSNAKGVDTIQQVATLVNQLQALAYGVVLPANQAFSAIADQPWPPENLGVLLPPHSPVTNIPLFIGVEQAGDDLPQTALRNGFTPLPTQMALGATWKVELAQQVGSIVGRELHGVGANLLLGPSLDVVDEIRTDSVGVLGVYSFGGNPYWVGQMGSAYIAGVHTGSNGRVATIVRHFPGQGDIDRFPDAEIATIQKSLDEVRAVAIAPFSYVTQNASIILHRSGSLGTADGMMTSHMRYTALPGGGGTPISLGPELVKTLEQEKLTEWHTNHGVLMSDAIGVEAIRRFYDPTGQKFPYLRIALDIFNAGHDLIYLDGMSTQDNWPESKKAIVDIAKRFQEYYSDNSDPDFAKRIDNSVRRILRLKLRLYGDSFIPTPVAPGSTITPTLQTTMTQMITATTSLTMSIVPLSKVLTTDATLQAFNKENLDAARKVVGQVAAEAITVLHPGAQNLPDVLPEAPQASDKVLVFSDSRLLYECKTGCTAETALGPDDIAKIIDRLYGKDGTGQLSKENISSRTFSELDQLLGPTAPAGAVAGSPTVTPVTPTAGVTSTTTTDVSVEGADKPSTQNQATTGANTNLEKLVADANWIIFAMLDINPQSDHESDVVRRFLGTEHGEQLKDKKIIVLALNAPYFLDATEISKLTAYFGVFSKTPPFIESAVRALFRGYLPTGAPPVSVPGTQFANLSERLLPDPAQTLKLHIAVADKELPLKPEVDTKPVVNVQDVLHLSVGPILDLNGEIVPDGVPVNFKLNYEGEALALKIDPATTRAGIANREISLERGGTLLVVAEAGAATSGDPIQLSVQDQAANLVTPVPNATLSTTVSNPTAAPPITATLSAANNGGGSASILEFSRPHVTLVTLAIAIFTILITLSLLLIAQVQILPRHTLVHNMLWATIWTGVFAWRASVARQA